MKHLLTALPLLAAATAAAAHEAAHAHTHATDANWLPLLGVLLVAGALAYSFWARK